jgi:beta-glucanase (GH16 family)
MNSSRNWNQGLFEVRVKIPNDNEFEPLIWLRPTDQESPRIILFSVLNSNPLTIQSGLLMESNKFAGFEEPFYNKLIANDFNVFSMEWRPNYICWRINDKIYWNLTLYHSECGKNSGTIPEELFNDRFHFRFGLNPDYSVHDSLEEYSSIPSYFYIDYIRVYHWEESNTNKSSGINILWVVLGSIIFVTILLITLVIIHMRRKIYKQSMNNSNQNNTTDLQHYDNNNVYRTIECNRDEMYEQIMSLQINTNNSEVLAQTNRIENENNYFEMIPTS